MRLRLKILIATTLISSIGCGGSGNGSSPSSFQGHWVGTWNRTVINDSGQFDLVIDKNGVITGITSKTNGQGTFNGTAKGTINSNGQTFIRLTYSNSTEFLNGSSAIYNEFVPLRLKGTGDISLQEFVYPATWSLDKQ